MFIFLLSVLIIFFSVVAKIVPNINGLSVIFKKRLQNSVEVVFNAGLQNGLEVVFNTGLQNGLEVVFNTGDSVALKNKTKLTNKMQIISFKFKG